MTEQNMQCALQYLERQHQLVSLVASVGVGHVHRSSCKSVLLQMFSAGGGIDDLDDGSDGVIFLVMARILLLLRCSFDSSTVFDATLGLSDASYAIVSLSAIQYVSHSVCLSVTVAISCGW